MFQLSRFIGFWEEDFEILFSIFFLVKIAPSIVSPPNLRGSWFEQAQIYPTWFFCTSFSFFNRLVSEKKMYLIYSYFQLFPIILSWKRVKSFKMFTILNHLCLRVISAKLGWNQLSGSGEDDANLKSLWTDRRTDDEVSLKRNKENLDTFTLYGLC